MSETGIQKNIANLKTLITYCRSYGDKYNPSNQDITLNGLEELYAKLKDGVALESKTKTKRDDSINERAAVFTGLEIFSTQVMNALRSADASAAKIEDAKAHNDKIQGTPAKGKKKDDKPKETSTEKGDATEAATGEAKEEEDNSISNSQQSYDNLAGHFSKLIDVIETESKYNPNEPEYAIKGLQEKLVIMETANAHVGTTISGWSNALIARNKGFSDDEKGLVHIAQLVKNHVKFVFKAKSQEFKHISKMEFRKIKER